MKMPEIVTLLTSRICPNLMVVLLLAGCATAGKPVPADGLSECRALFQQVDAAVDHAAIQDYGPSRVKGFPYLRTDRLLASFRDEVADPSRWAAWTGRMAELDAQARALELRNLPHPVEGHHGSDIAAQLASCRELLIADDLARPERRAALHDAVNVPDDYVTWWRIAGLYPITANIVSAKVSAWHDETHESYDKPLASLPVMGELVRWAPRRAPDATPLSADQTVEILRRSVDPLGIPMPAAGDLDRLFDAFAPIWEVDVTTDDDRIGKVLRSDGARVDTVQPTQYRKVSHTRFGGNVLLQLNYTIWFPARPGSDIYAGPLDGIIWRVTLGPDGTPWLYDTIHNCGCYHTFFPTDQLRLRADLPGGFFEPPLVPQSAPAQQPLTVRIANRTHLVLRLHHEEHPAVAQEMQWDDYDALRSLTAGDGSSHSLFGKYGLVEGTERTERFVLWPMGIRSPGAMRQWGHHATAFVGRRHFDDPFLLDALFEQHP